MYEIYFDSNNPSLLRDLMLEYGNSQFPFHGTNEDGEEVEIHICSTSIIHKTYQSNGWIRANYFNENGLPDGEIFEGRWK